MCIKLNYFSQDFSLKIFILEKFKIIAWRGKQKLRKTGPNRDGRMYRNDKLEFN